MKNLREFFHERPLAIGTSVAFLANCFLWLYLSLRLTSQAENAPLHYNIYFGIDLVGPWWYFYGFAAVGFGILLVNTLLSVILHSRERTVAFFLTFSDVIVQFLLFFAVYLALTNI